MYAPPPPRTKSSGRSCLLVVIILLALVCVAGVAGAALFRDRLRDIPLKGGGFAGRLSTVSVPPNARADPSVS
jgi:hypothetical protein